MTIKAQKNKIKKLNKVINDLTEQKSVNSEQSIVDLNKIIALEEQMYGILRILIFRNYYN